MSRYEYILFDWDGNLAKTLDVWLEACRVPLERRGLNLSDEEIAASFGAINTHMDKWGIADKEAVIAEADNLAKKMLPDVELYPDVLVVLETLHQQGKKLALITTSIIKNIDHLLEKHNLHQFFDVVITYEDTVLHKPHPEPLEKALEVMGGDKKRAVMIGDSDKDINAATNAEIDSVLFYPPEHKKFYNLESLRQHAPTYVVSDFRTIIDIVN